MSSVLDQRSAPPADGPRPAPPPRRTRLLSLPETRWALAALVLFLLALPVHLLHGPGLLGAALFAATYVTGGWEPGWAGLKALKDRTLDVDLLMVVAALGAAAIGQVLDGALLIVIFATSGALEAVATARTADSVRGLLDLAPATAVRLLPDGTEESVDTGTLAVGDTVLVRPGSGSAPTAGWWTGPVTWTRPPSPASRCRSRNRWGTRCSCGTVNGAGALRVRVDRDPSDSVIARIVKMVADASGTKAPTQLFIERIEQRYSVGMVVVTLAVFGVPLTFGDTLDSALLRAMTFMIVASPCAVVLSTMPPLLSAIANAGRHGVLVKSAVVMERLGQIDAVALDKTGTLTEGTPRVTDVRPATASGLSEDELLRLAAAAEHPSEHPLARALVDAARAKGLGLPCGRGFPVHARHRGQREGGGPHGGGRQPCPSPRHPPRPPLRRRGGEPGGEGPHRRPGHCRRQAGRCARRRRPAARGGRYGGRRAGRTHGDRPLLVTGDNLRAAALLAAEAGLTEVRADLLPQDKVSVVREMERAYHKVLVVGDGVNDAPALAAAHSGIAMGRVGSDLALDTADAIVVRDELAAVPAVVRLSRAARRLVTQNLAIAGVFLTVLVAWDLIGTLPLPLGVAGHEGSTVVVGLNGLRLLREAAWPRPTKDPA